MPKHEKPIRQWNALTYLRDFINSSLIFTEEEERILNHLLDIQMDLPVATEPITDGRYRCCFRCGEIKTLNEFKGKNFVCIECRRKEGKWKHSQSKN